MSSGGFDALTRMLAGFLTRRGTLGALAALLAFLLSPFGRETANAKNKRRGCRRVSKKCGGKHNRKCCDHAKCRGGRCKCTGQRKACRGTCIPQANCCDDADCDGGATCENGACECPAGEKACNGACIPNDNCCANSDCGACESCDGGACVSGCQNGQECVSGICRCTTQSCHGCCAPEESCAPGNEPEVCGRGGDTCIPCNLNETCPAGACLCEAPFTACGADCVDLSNDNDHCGGCGNACVGAATCQNGACRAGGIYTLINQWDITGPTSQPFGIAVDGQGDVYVTDLGGNNVLKFTASGDPIDDWSSVGDGPIGVAVNRSTGDIYVANANSDALQPFASDAIPREPWTLLDSPNGVAVNQSNGEVYVTIVGSNAVGVQRFTSDGDVIANWLAPDYPFQLPLGIGIAPNGDVYVSDDGACEVFRFTADGEPFPVTSCDGPIEFDDPWGVAVDGASDVYICDSGNQRLLKTTADFNLIGQIGDETNFEFPVGVAVSLSGYVYVADSGNSNVQQFEPA